MKDLRVTKPDKDDFYVVESLKDQRVYHVQMIDHKGSCSCPAFLEHWDLKDWRCEHLIAVEEVLNMEEQKVFDAKSTTINRTMLEKPFESNQIKQREGMYGDRLDYIEVSAVIARLNDAFEADWSFEVDKYEVREEEVVVLGKLTACGITKMQFGSSEIDKDDTGKVLSVGDCLKAAASASIRKSATLFGIGLYLFEDRKPQSKQLPENTPPPANLRDGRLTNKQLAAIYAISKAKGFSRQEVEKKILETYSKKPDYLTKDQASALIEELNNTIPA